MLSPRRTACDRCRSHKLRCIREGGTDHDGACQRCHKVGLDCKTNAGARIGRLKNTSHAIDDRDSLPHEHSIGHLNQVQSHRRSDEQQFPTPASSATESCPSQNPTASRTSDSAAVLDQLLQQSSYSTTTLSVNDNVISGSYGATTSNQQPLEILDPSKLSSLTPPIDRREECERKLAGLHSTLILDLNILRGCETAGKCSDIINTPEFSQNYNFMIGRMLSSSATFVEVLQYFVPPPGSIAQQEAIHCDVPTQLSIFTCYAYLIRLYRIVFTCIYDSILESQAANSKLPPLFPGVHLGGFPLESHVDLQVKILVEVGENMLAKIENALGVSEKEGGTGLLGLMRNAGTSAGLLQLMLKEETAEEHIDGILVGHGESLADILKALKAIR